MRRLRRRWRNALILAFWVFAVAMLSLRALLVDSQPFSVLGPRRVLIAIFGAVLCIGMARLLEAARNLVTRVVIGLVGALFMSITVTMSAMAMNRLIAPIPDAAPITFAESAQWVLVWFGYFLAWTGTYLALSYHWAAQDEQHRARLLEAANQSAEMAALRYQLNPHFLFNVFNSLSSLVMEGRKELAEKALLKMAEFVRATLSNAPSGTIDLREEVRLQRTYLEVEQLRFGDRLGFQIDVDPGAQSVQVPALILQPLVENAIRHGVSKTDDPVRIAVSAVESNGSVRITVTDDARSGRDAAEPGEAGSGIGLNNVRQRLQLHYGDEASLETGWSSGGGFEAVIIIPVRARG